MATKPKVIKKPSPHHGGKIKPKYIVLHHTAGKMPSDLNTLTSKKYEVSANYLIDKDGNIYEIVPAGTAAWHAGAGGPYKDVPKDAMNSHSIGIELSNLGTGKDKFTDKQLVALDKLIAWLDTKYGKLAIIDHQTWAPKRKAGDIARNFPLKTYQKYRRHSVAKKSAPTKQAAPAPKQTEVTHYSYKVDTDVGHLNVRDKPSADARIVHQLRRGETITGRAAQDGWVKISHNGITGYCMAKYLDKK